MNDRRPVPPPAEGSGDTGSAASDAASTGATSAGATPTASASTGAASSGPEPTATTTTGPASADPGTGPRGATSRPEASPQLVDPDAPGTVGGSAEAHPASTAAAPHAEPHRFDRRMLEALVCPATRAPLAYDAHRQELFSRAAHLAYPIRDGIPIMLVHEARETD